MVKNNSRINVFKRNIICLFTVIVLTFIICIFVEVPIGIQQLAVYSKEVNHTIDLNKTHSADVIWDRKTSYPFRGDPECQDFVVQVCDKGYVFFPSFYYFNCAQYAMKYFVFIIFKKQLAEKDSLPKWALTSFPGSGVTWTRQLIEGVTGIYTGSVYLSDPLPVKPQSSSNCNFFQLLHYQYLSLKKGKTLQATRTILCAAAQLSIRIMRLQSRKPAWLATSNYFITWLDAPLWTQAFYLRTLYAI